MKSAETSEQNKCIPARKVKKDKLQMNQNSNSQGNLVVLVIPYIFPTKKSDVCPVRIQPSLKKTFKRCGIITLGYFAQCNANSIRLNTDWNEKLRRNYDNDINQGHPTTECFQAASEVSQSSTVKGVLTSALEACLVLPYELFICSDVLGELRQPRKF